MNRLDILIECQQIADKYNRYNDNIVDHTTNSTCAALLYWMDCQEKFKDVIFRPGENKGNLKQVWGQNVVKDIIDQSKKESKRMRHKKKTIDRCWQLLLKDLRIEEFKNN